MFVVPPHFTAIREWARSSAWTWFVDEGIRSVEVSGDDGVAVGTAIHNISD